MRFYEFAPPTKRVLNIQPSSVQKQQRVNAVISKIAASDQQQPPTEDEKAIASLQYHEMKTEREKIYAQNLRRQLAKIDANNANGSGRPRR